MTQEQRKRFSPTSSWQVRGKKEKEKPKSPLKLQALVVHSPSPELQTRLCVCVCADLRKESKKPDTEPQDTLSCHKKVQHPGHGFVLAGSCISGAEKEVRR